MSVDKLCRALMVWIRYRRDIGRVPLYRDYPKQLDIKQRYLHSLATLIVAHKFRRSHYRAYRLILKSGIGAEKIIQGHDNLLLIDGQLYLFTNQLRES